MRSGLFLALILAFFHSIPARSATAPGPDFFGYSVATTMAFSFTNIANGGRVLYFNDDDALTVNIGFNFNFYGVNYTSLAFNPNGLITFGGASTDFNNVDLTTSVPPSNNLPCIAVLWDDWETQSVGSDGLYYKTLGTAGSRQFIVQWNNVMPVNGPGTNTVTFQARLFEGSNQILLSYLDVVVADDPSYGNGAFATVGIRDADGQTNNRNLLWSHNQAIISDGESILFTRPVSLSIQRVGSTVVLSWPQGTLQSAPNVTGTYTNVPGAISPYTNAPTGSRKFYRVQVSP